MDCFTLNGYLALSSIPQLFQEQLDTVLALPSIPQLFQEQLDTVLTPAVSVPEQLAAVLTPAVSGAAGRCAGSSCFRSSLTLCWLNICGASSTAVGRTGRSFGLWPPSHTLTSGLSRVETLPERDHSISNRSI
jgi:hypothetical protein